MSNSGSKKISFYFLIIFFCILGGVLFFFIQREWVIFKFNFGFGKTNSDLFSKQDLSLRRKVKMYYWKDEKILFEEQMLIWFANKSETLKHLVNNWLSFLHQERLIDKKISLETVMIDQGGQQAYFSFNQNPFDHEWSIFHKYSLIECLFKTIKNSGIDTKTIVFLVGNQAMEDDHLDFSKDWPIDGFLQEYQNL